MTTYSNLQEVAPPAVEPITLELAKQHLRVDNSGDDALIPYYISAARQWAEDYLGWVLAKRQFQWTVMQQPPTGAWPYVALPFPVAIYPLWYPWPAVQQQWLDLPRGPLISVDEISVGTWGQPDVTLDATTYDVDAGTGRIRMRPPANGQNDHVAVLFTAGFTNVPANVTTALLMLTAFLYENRGDAGGEMPMVARTLMQTIRRVNFGG